MKNVITKKTVGGIAKEIKVALEENRCVSVETFNKEAKSVCFEREEIYTGRPGGSFSFTVSSFTSSGSLTAVSRRSVERLVSQIKRGFEVNVKVYE